MVHLDGCPYGGSWRSSADDRGLTTLMAELTDIAIAADPASRERLPNGRMQQTKPGTGLNVAVFAADPWCCADRSGVERESPADNARPSDGAVAPSLT